MWAILKAIRDNISLRNRNAYVFLENILKDSFFSTLQHIIMNI